MKKTLKAAVIGFLVVLALCAVGVTFTWLAAHPWALAAVLLAGMWVGVSTVVRSML